MHVGRIRLSQELILEWLDYVGGKIGNVRLDFETLSGDVELTIEHPDMPEVKEAEKIPIVTPLYVKFQDAQGHFCVMRKRDENQ